MKTTILRSSLAALACTAVLAIASTSMAANVNLKADLKASSEVPPTDSKGTGSVTATYDTASKKLSWKGSISGLSGPATAAHFHSGEAGKNGGVAVPIAGADKGAVRRFGDAYRRTGRGTHGRQVVRERPHCRQQGWRDPRPSDQIK